MIRKFIGGAVAAATLAAFSIAPAAAAPRAQGPGTIADIVAASGGTFDRNPTDYDLLLNAVQAAGLVGALADESASLTVFAPNDGAFVRTARDLGFKGFNEGKAWDFLVGALTQIGGGDPIPVLTNVLLYHVAGEKLGPVEVLTAGEIDTLLGASFGVDGVRLVDNDPNIPDADLNIFRLNIQASNGVIHGVTRVLIPVDLP